MELTAYNTISLGRLCTLYSIFQTAASLPGLRPKKSCEMTAGLEKEQLCLNLIGRAGKKKLDRLFSHMLASSGNDWMLYTLIYVLVDRKSPLLSSQSCRRVKAKLRNKMATCDAEAAAGLGPR